MKRAGFTMIELIFVIVILGILAAVAIPKLAATRTDAQIAKISSNVGAVLKDMGAYYTSQGTMATNWYDMTNVALETAAGTPATAATTAVTTVYISDGTNNCISFVSTADGNLTIGNAGSASTVCDQVELNVAAMLKTHNLGGIGVQ